MINCIGTLQGTSGYASHYRGLVNELNKLIDCKIVTNLTPGFEREVNDKELEMLKREQDFDINLIITHPLYWRSNLSAKRNFVYLIWEGDRIPSWIVKECMNNKIDKIIVPSNHTYNALKNGFEEHDPDAWLGIGDDAGNNKIVVIPHGHNPEEFFPMEVKGSDKFKFLANKGLRNLEDRGGLQYLINAFLEEFKQGEAELHLKINAAYGIPDFLKLFPNLKDRTDVIFHVNNMSTKQLNELYNSCDVFVSPTRAEAFNIPCLEAMSCGKPVITTNFGGQTDFVNEENGWLIDYDLTEVKHEIEYEGIKWATPIIDHLQELLRSVFVNNDFDKPKLEIADKGKRSLETAQELTWSNTAKQIYKLI